MITKGIVESIIDTYFAKVRLPVYDGVRYAPQSVPTEDLSESTLCVIGGHIPHLKQGDVVFVGFEDNDMGKPIILGMLYNENSPKSATDATLNSLKVSVNTVLSSDTTIGDVSSTDIKNLSGTTGNLQKQIDLAEQKIKTLSESSSSVVPVPLPTDAGKFLIANNDGTASWVSLSVWQSGEY